MRSLRANVLLGAAFWTIGLSSLLFAVIGQVSLHFPDTPLIGRNGGIHYWPYHTRGATATGLLFMAAGVLQVRRGFAGITRLRRRLGAVHRGMESRVEGQFVSEVQPLVDDLNGLLAHHEQAVQRAVAKAGDLAHGLKTPLAILTQEAARASAAGHRDVAASIEQQVERMRRQIDYHLAHARAAASGVTLGARCLVEESADALARTLLRLHAERTLRIDVRAAPGHAARVQREDLDEMLGNLLDNACKWARSTVVVDSADTGTAVIVTVDDDGAGLPAELRETVLERGVRADEKAPGFGLGLAIVRDLADLYGGSIALAASPLGGVRATLTLPRAA